MTPPMAGSPVSGRISAAETAWCESCRRYSPLAELLRVEHIRTGAASFVHRPGFGRPVGEPCVRSVGSAAVYRLSLAAPPDVSGPAARTLAERWLQEDVERAARIAAEHRPTADQW